MPIIKIRNKIALITACTIIGLIFQSLAFGSPSTEANLSTPFTMQVGKTIEIKSEKLTITLTDIRDSRCPKDVTCVWEGEVVLNLSIRHGDNNSKETNLEIKTSNSSEISFDDYLIELAKVEPYPVSTKEIKKDKYVVSLVVKSQQILSPLKQFKAGIFAGEIKCKESMILVQKYNGDPACVKPTTAQKLQERGWTTNITHTNQNENNSESITITQENNNQEIEVKKGNTFLLKLGEDHNWNIEIDNDNIVSRIKNIAVIRGAQGIYEAKMSGNAILSAVGEPICRDNVPPCAAPTILFRIHVNVP